MQSCWPVKKGLFSFPSSPGCNGVCMDKTMTSPTGLGIGAQPVNEMPPPDRKPSLEGGLNSGAFC